MHLRFSIERLHLLLLAYVVGVSAATGAWITYTVARDWARTEWMERVDRVGDLIMEAGAEAAMERGLGTVALAAGGAPAGTVRERLAAARREGEGLYRRVLAAAERLPGLWRDAPLPQGRTAFADRVAALRAAHGRLEQARERLHAALAGDAADAIAPERWFNAVSDYNEHLLGLLQVASATPGWVPMPFAGCTTGKTYLFRENTGLGLAVVRKLVEAAGGRIELHSQGRGTRFRFSWPALPLGPAA